MPENYDAIDRLCYFVGLRPMPKPSKRKGEKIYFFTINFEKKCIYAKLSKGEEITIKCHEEDEFDWEIGLGIAISKLRDNSKYQAHRKFYRSKTTGKLMLEPYTKWVLREFYKNDMYDWTNLKIRVENELKEKGKNKILIIDL